MDTQKELNKYKNRASEYLEDKEKVSDLLENAKNRANKNKGPLEEVWDNLMLSFELVKDWINGNYREIPKKSLIGIVGGLIYFVSPIDVIVDAIPFLGFLDDAAVLGFVIKQVEQDLQNYRMWKGR